MALKIDLIAVGPGVIQLGGIKDQRIVKAGEKFSLDDGKEAKWMVEAGVAVLASAPPVETPEPKGAKVVATAKV